MLFHGGVQLLREVIGHAGQAGFLFVGSAEAALVLVGLLVVFLLGILAVALAALSQDTGKLLKEAHLEEGEPLAQEPSPPPFCF